MKIIFNVVRPGTKYTSPKDLTVDCEYHKSTVEKSELIEYTSVTDSYGYNWLEHLNGSFIAYLDKKVIEYISQQKL